MPATIVVTRLPVLATERGILQTLFASAGLSLLKEMVAAKCIEAQVDMANAMLYPNNESAAATSKEMARRAAEYGRCLDILDEIGEKEEEWYTIKTEHSR